MFLNLLLGIALLGAYTVGVKMPHLMGRFADLNQTLLGWSSHYDTIALFLPLLPFSILLGTARNQAARTNAAIWAVLTLGIGLAGLFAPALVDGAVATVLGLFSSDVKFEDFL